ncbi:protein kinase [Nocardia sp. NPDC051030]|uniref:serine/threonine-protein kinase n=1 Tax=Nocardia sp. NPDC051030 TaxID=3155162 RepID=UPI0034159F6A
MLRSGETFAGYLIERELGRGGMGSVYLARHPRLPRLLALKLLNRELFGDAEVRARFEREGDVVARLDHPNIVPVYDRGFDDDRLWIAMRYIDGVDASALDSATLPPRQAIRIVADTAKGLDFAHRKGVLHRDVKPANILLERVDGEERVFLADFGIARLRDESSAKLTQTGSFTATLAYAAPEQLSGHRLDHRCDQYSLACTLFRLLTGTVPFTAEHPVAIMQGHLNQPPPPVSSLRAGLPPALDGVLARALAKHPGARFDSCTEFAVAAEQAMNGPGSAPPMGYPPNRAPAGSPPPAAPLGRQGYRHVVQPPVSGTPPRQFAPPVGVRTPPAAQGRPATRVGGPNLSSPAPNPNVAVPNSSAPALNPSAPVPNLSVPAANMGAPGATPSAPAPTGPRTAPPKPYRPAKKKRSRARGCLLGLALLIAVPLLAGIALLAYLDRASGSNGPSVVTTTTEEYAPTSTPEETYEPSVSVEPNDGGASGTPEYPSYPSAGPQTSGLRFPTS